MRQGLGAGDGLEWSFNNNISGYFFHQCLQLFFFNARRVHAEANVEMLLFDVNNKNVLSIYRYSRLKSLSIQVTASCSNTLDSPGLDADVGSQSQHQ